MHWTAYYYILRRTTYVVCIGLPRTTYHVLPYYIPRSTLLLPPTTLLLPPTAAHSYPLHYPLQDAPEQDPEENAVVPDRVSSLSAFLADVRETGVGGGLQVALANMPSSTPINETLRDLAGEAATLALAVSRVMRGSADLILGASETLHRGVPGGIFHSGAEASLPGRLQNAAAAAKDAISPPGGAVSPSELVALAQSAAAVGGVLAEQVARLVVLLEGEDPHFPSSSSLTGAVLLAQDQAAALGNNISAPAVASAVASPSSRARWLQELHAPSSGLDLGQTALQLQTAAARVRASGASVVQSRAIVQVVRELCPAVDVACPSESESEVARMVRPLREW